MKRYISSFLCGIMLFVCLPYVGYATENEITNVMVETVGQYLYETVPQPQVGSVGGEWAVMGLTRSGLSLSQDYFERYYQSVIQYVQKHNGRLHETKYTEYARVILALTALGYNPADVGGYNLFTPLGDYEKTVRQGINGAIWALLALDCGAYAIPKNETAAVQAGRDLYVNYILDSRTSDGGWALSGDIADPDVTGMALQALARYQTDDRVKMAIEQALLCMSERQDEKGGFSSWGTENAESCAQMLVALCELGLSLHDERFVKNDNTILDSLLTYYQEGQGFCHTHDSAESNQMATEQCFYALVALKRSLSGQNSLYDMRDVVTVGDDATEGLSAKHQDVRKTTLLYPAVTFSDITEHESRTAIEALARRGILNGKTTATFEPNATMTRAEFATAVTRALGLPLQSVAVFDDVAPNTWFYQFAGTASIYGIIRGISDTAFAPDNTVSREEAAVMVTRAAGLCGMTTEVASGAVRDCLAVFSDYVKTASWAQNALAFCIENDILSDEMAELRPKAAATRAEVVEMLYHMLLSARLL